MKNVNLKRTQTGFTLIEVMVSLALTSLLILGAGTLFSTTGRSSRVQTSIAALNETGRFAIDTLARDLRMAGFREANWALGAIADPIVAVDGVPADGGDTLTIQYESARDCNFAPTVDGLATNVYSIIDDTLDCNGQAIVDGIEQMQVYFGEDTDDDGVANRLLPPDSVGLEMDRVVSVRIHFLAHTNAVNLALGQQQFYFDNMYQVPIDDGQIRREYSLTLATRNPI
jgi:type IV pilus assembly protein PilW